mgnify:CR=1 FL=1
MLFRSAAYSDDHMRAGTDYFRRMLQPPDSHFATHTTDETNFKFAGFDIRQYKEHIRISQESYTSQFSLIPEQTPLDAKRKELTKRYAHKLLWHAKCIRPDLIYDSAKVAHAKHQLLDEVKKVNALIIAVQETADFAMPVPKLDMKSMRLLAFADFSGSAQQPFEKHQVG